MAISSVWLQVSLLFYKYIYYKYVAISLLFASAIRLYLKYIHIAGVKIKFEWPGRHNVEIVDDEEAFDSCTVTKTNIGPN